MWIQTSARHILDDTTSFSFKTHKPGAACRHTSFLGVGVIINSIHQSMVDSLTITTTTPVIKNIRELNLSVDESGVESSFETVGPVTIFRDSPTRMVAGLYQQEEEDPTRRNDGNTTATFFARATPVKDQFDSSMEESASYDEEPLFHDHHRQTEELHEQELVEWRLHPVVVHDREGLEPGQSIDFSPFFPISRDQDIMMDCYCSEEFSVSSNEASCIEDIDEDLGGIIAANPSHFFDKVVPRDVTESPAVISVETTTREEESSSSYSRSPFAKGFFLSDPR